jgi:hypothetical protein
MDNENEANLESQAHELKEKLEKKSKVTDVWVSRIGFHSANVCVLYEGPELSADFLKTVGNYGDLRVEGIDLDNNLELVAFVS